ncbi:MAG TPA: alanine racemase [Phenylobacterium sp.]|jgi:alanine racemase|uniref:alanine racemase n=1 Tax=Phenylobacterium sp. TaxID=1871053 RepID=UPI002CBC8800|nr:alanine racemase [Phenylobacterium sp.]HXA39337.1 alanine racemase [Phenylobacterium sp.]
MSGPLIAPSGARLTIDLDALAHNHALLRSEAAGAEVAPVLKSDAYGLGAGPVGRRLWAEGARSFFVARLTEGEALRAALTPGRPAAIYVLDGLTEGAEDRLAAAALTPVISSLSQMALAAARGARDGRPLPVALNIDTGMSRQGLTAEETRAVVQSLDRLRGLDVGLVMSHLGSAGEPGNPRNAAQLARFLEARALFPQACASLSASAGVFLGADYRFDLVRPGVSLFGGGPRERPDPRLKAVATLTAPILDVRNLRPGDVVGYGESVRIETPTRVAVVGAGYTDGVIRAARGGANAWFAGAPRRILIINMDILVMELGDAPAEMGEPVELIGPNAPVDDLAAAGGTVAHEILVRLSRRAERLYLGEV